MDEEQEFHLNTADGLRIHGSLFLPRRPRSLFLFLHGFGEHRRRYRNLALWFQKKKVGFACIDLRGHGESGGRPGHILAFEDYYQDVQVFFHWIREHFKNYSIFVGGHSLGSLIALRFFQSSRWQHPVHGLILSAPFLGFFQQMTNWQSSLIRTAADVWPGLKLPARINPDLLSHNADSVMAYRFDPAIVRRPRARWLAQVIKHQALAMAAAPQIRLPSLLLQGLDDRITSAGRARRFYDMLDNDKQWLAFPGMYHEVLNEPGAEKIYASIHQWMKKHL